MSNNPFKWRNEDDDGNTENRGKTTSDNDGSMNRWDNYSPSSNNSNKHHHEWINKLPDGTYEYGYGEHDNHSGKDKK